MKLSKSTLLETVIESVKQNDFVDDVVVATSVASIDDLIEEKCKSISVTCFRGDEKDVLSRFIQIAKHLKPNDIIVRVTADNPINNSKKSCELLQMHITNGSDYTCVEGLSHVVYEFVNADALLRLENNDELNIEDKEHVTKYIREHPNEFKVLKVQPAELKLKPNLDKLLTVDTKSDYLRVEKVFNELDDSQIRDFTILYNYLESNFA